MNRDREEIDRQLTARNAGFKLPSSSPNVWQRLTSRQRNTMRAMAPEAFDGCPRPAFFNTHAADYSRSAYEASHIGEVPPIPAVATQVLSYADPGGAATMTELERLTLKMINNHEASDKLFAAESRDQTHRRLHSDRSMKL